MLIDERILLIGSGEASVTETELLRSLGNRGCGTLGLRIMNSAELAGFMLMHSGISVPEKVITSSEAAAIVSGLLREEEYFRFPCSEDAAMFIRSLNTMRLLITGDEEQVLARTLNAGSSPRGRAILSIYRKYVQTLRDRGELDRIMLLRRAAEEAGPLECRRLALKDIPPAPLERLLLERAGGYEELTLAELYGAKEQGISIADITEAYGSENEAENVICRIFTEGLPLDSCELVAADSALVQLLYDLSVRFDIDMRFGCGIPAGNTAPARMLRDLGNWYGPGLMGKEALTQLVYSDSFDRDALKKALGLEDKGGELHRAVETAGSLRLGLGGHVDRQRVTECRLVLEEELRRAQELEESQPLKGGKEAEAAEARLKALDLAERLGQELAQGAEYLVRHYGLIRQNKRGPADAAAREMICRELATARELAQASGAEPDLLDLIPQLLKRQVLRDNSAEGAIFVTDLGHALGSLRQEVFIMGLSAGVFPGSPTEDPLVTDEELRAMDPDCTVTSEEKIKQRIELMKRLVITAGALGARVHLSYPSFDTAQLKDINASSVLFDLFGEWHRDRTGEEAGLDDFRSALTRVGFFDSLLEPGVLVGRSYCAGELAPMLSRSGYGDYEAPKKQMFSPTELEALLNCPKKFLYTSILGMKEPDPDDPRVLMDPRDMGILIHSLMEQQGREKLDRSAFLARGEELFEGFLKKRPPVNAAAAQRQRMIFMACARGGYELDPISQGVDSRRVILAEEKLRANYTAQNGMTLTLSGIPDRVELLPDGRVLIADYKTGAAMRHTKNDPESCIQTMIYAYILESMGYEPAGGEYRYLRLGTAVTCDWALVKPRVLGILDDLALRLEQGLFQCNTGGWQLTNCRWCGFSSICNVVQKTLDQN